MSDKFVLPLEANLDREGKKYYLARLKAPIEINAKDGIVFLIFTSIEGEEELQIASFNTPKYNGKYKEQSYVKKPEVLTNE